MTQTIEAQYLNVRDAATWVGMGKSTIQRAIATGTLKSFRRGARILIAKSDLKDWVEENTTV